jgi:transposase
MNHRVRSGQVQTHDAGFQADEEHGNRGLGLKPLHDGGPVRGGTVEITILNFLLHQSLLQKGQHIPGKILILWDGAPIHRSLLVKNYVAATEGRIVVERLPAYAPELNPVEYMWGHLKTHEIANLIATQAWELSLEATAALRRMRRRNSVIAACYSQAELWP